MNACDAIRPRLEELRVDLLSPTEREAAEEHVQACPDCEARLRRIREIERALLEAPEPDVDIHPLVQEGRSRLARERRRKEAIPMAAAALLLLSLLAWLSGIGSGGGTSTSQDVFEEKRLGEGVPPAEEKVAWSLDGRHWAYRESVERPRRVEIPGQPGNYREITRRVRRMVVDGQPGQDFWAVSQGVFSPDGRKLAYVAARRSSNVSLVILEIGKGERVLEREFEDISSWSGDDGAGPPSLLWSPTSASVAFVGRRGTETVVGVDDATRGSHEEVTELAWSADGKSFAYVARHGGEWFVVRDGKKGEIFDRVLHLSFAPDGVPAYMAKEDQFLLIWGTRRGPRFAQAGRPAFSADGQKVAYSVGGRMILNGGGGQDCDAASDPVFSPDGRRLAYRAKLGEGERIVIRDGGEETMEASFNRVDVPRFSPSGDVVAYRAWRGDKQVMVVGPRVGEKFSRVGDPVFSPDGRVVAYAGARYGKEVVVVGERLSEEVDQVLWGPVFSADGKKVSYRARIGAELWSKVLDVP